MKKNKTLLPLLIMVCFGFLQHAVAQTIATQSIGLVGFVSQQNGQDRLNWNVGEVLIGQTNGQDYLNQGLYHHFDLVLFNKRPNVNPKLFTVFPTPTNGQVSINSNQKITISIIGSNGEIIDKLKIKENEFQTDISYLPNGTYYFVAKSDDNTVKAIKIILIK